MKNLLIVLPLLLIALAATAQQTAQPGTGVAYTNTVTYDAARDSYLFNCSGGTGSPIYFRCAASSPSFSGIYVSADNGVTEFRPSIGGLTVILDGVVTQYFGGQAAATKLSQALVQDTLITSWRLKRTGTSPAAVQTFDFTSKYYIKGRTLVNELVSSARNVRNVTFDRCEEVVNPQVVNVPFLSGFNVLLANNNLFVSSFFDWTYSNASTNPNNSGTVTGSTTSVRYAPNATYNTLTNGQRNPLREKAYITVSENLSEVLPNIPNPVSRYRGESARRVVFDYWQDARNINAGAGVTANHYGQLRTGGIDRSTLWLIIHPWQNQGYDNGYPDVQPARAVWGGDAQLRAASDTVTNAGGLFSLHENFTTIHDNAPTHPANIPNIAKFQNGSLSASGANSFGAIPYGLKNSAAPSYSARYSPPIHSTYNTGASYLDVASSIPLGFVDQMDYDAAVPNTGKYSEILRNYQSLYETLRQAHNGPVSGEGNQHLYAVGHVDDVEAQPGMAIANGNIGGWRFPLLVDFQHEKLNPKAFVHGMGYMARFYGTQTQPAGVRFSRDSVLMYMATTLAYGNGGFITSPDRVYSMVEYAQLTQKHIYSMQESFVSSTPTRIRYNDNGTLLTASQYVAKYPAGYKDFTSADFMGQVLVEYGNGTVVCVNRHPTKSWNVTVGQPGGWFNYNALINGVKTQDTLTSNTTAYLLPPKSGWVCYLPANINAQTAAPIPGIVEAEDFNKGKQGVAYQDADASNNGAAYRSTAVDIEATTDTGGGFAVRDIVAGEWLKYTISAPATGPYSVSARIAAQTSGNVVRLEVDGQVVVDSIEVDATGGADQWATVPLASITMPEGVHTLRFFVISGTNFKLNRLTFNNAAPLPVELISFTAQTVGRDALLRWRTASETDNDRFEVEASTDGNAFTRIGTMAGQGTTSRPQVYQFRDQDIIRYNASLVHYRLHLLDANNQSQFSPVRSVTVAGRNRLTAMAAPLPFGGAGLSLTLGGFLRGPISLRVYDMLGRSRFQKSQVLTEGTSILQVPELSQLATGVYILSVEQAGQQVRQRIVRE
ncbi:carbohydrate-binding domain-containing protein [Hymenobacter sp.]|uniref:carbohydrate-binding domain-containing protein n=1 Tax=Hymenobacter sp. TaxID=1898978 RepID=UPI00286A0413|nr:carbohydrate-binding domain-containing protein [Hymenobacter sp.]